ncbi:MAG: substrate-binding domain-containing protein [Bacteroidales bacterium]|nr:substrate-binding domain-containing protein [Bacteroidales bacterium]
MKKFLLSAVALATLGLLSTGCTKYKDQQKAVSGFAKVYCDESFRNILEQEIAIFEYQYPQSNVMARYMSESAALDSLLNDNVDLIITQKDLTQDQKRYLAAKNRAYRSRMIAVDAVALIVNKNCDIDELSMQELTDLMTGKHRTWGKIVPTKMRNDSIRLLFDGNASGVIHYAKEKFLGGKEFTFPVYSAKSSEEVFQLVEKNRNAIGFVGVSWIADDMGESQKNEETRFKELNKSEQETEPSAIDFTNRVKVLKVRSMDRVTGVKPYQAYIADGSYPLFRKIYAIDAAHPGMPAHQFFVFLTGVIGQKIILQTGIMPGAEPVRVVDVSK